MASQRDGDLRGYVESLCDELLLKANNAALRKKPTMWAYYRKMREHVCRIYGSALEQNEDAIVAKAAWVEQEARHMCLASKDATDGDKALWYAYGVYARRIMRHAGMSARGWVSLWLKPEAAE